MRPRMHPDELAIDGALVRRLVATQLPQWADLPIALVESTGTSNALYRLGEVGVVRLPLRPGAGASVAREHRWLPVLAPQLPVAVPAPLALGAPTDDYPSPWSVYPWLDGVDGTEAQFDPLLAAQDLAGFLRALRAIDPTGGPAPIAGRGVPLADRDQATRAAIAASRGLIDAGAVTAAWERALAAPAQDRPGRWIHGDVAAGNLLFRGGRLSAVIDFAMLGVGDPACDLLVAWELFDAPTRRAFRGALGVDDATWARGRGWAISTAIVALPYYQLTNAFMAEQARRKLAAALDGG